MTRIGSLFSGAGGLDLAVEAVFNGEVIWQSEIDPAASKVLAHRFPCAPNLGDITQIDWATVETPDVLCLGFPCQDVSAAGRRAGIKDGTRSGLWAVAADAIDALKPGIVIIENVRGLLNAKAHRNMEPSHTTVGDRSGGPVLRAAGAVLGDLADMGYDAQWGTVAAADVGAPHRRERVFIVATDTHYTPTSIRSQQRGSTNRAQDATDWELTQAAQAYDDVELVPTPVTTDAKSSGRHTTTTGVMNSGTSLTDWCRQLPNNDLLPTPCAQQSGNTPENHLAKKPGRKVVTDLAILVENGLLQSGGELLPTPQSMDGSGGRVSRTLGGQRQSGAKRSVTLSTAVHHHLLPTPNASDSSGGGQHPDKREGHSRQLIDYVLTDNTQWGKYEPAIRRWEQLTRPAPAATEPNKNGKRRLNASFSEWLMGWPEGWVTDPHIGISRNDQLRIIGNGVVPQQAIAALTHLLTIKGEAA